MTKSTNTLETEPAMSRRQIVMIGAGLATAGVIGTWFYQRNRRTATAEGPLNRPGKRPKLPADQLAKELAKPGPLPEIVVGKEDAPVTIVEYADLTCPACAAFHNTVLPKLKEKYLDTGKVRLVFREFPTNGVALLAFMAARCVPTDKAPPLLSALFARQDDWRNAASIDQLRDKLFSVSQQFGLTRQAFDACVPTVKGDKLQFTSAQEPVVAKLTEVRNRAHESFSVSQTPTFFVNGKRLPHATLEEFDKALTPLITQ